MVVSEITAAVQSLGFAKASFDALLGLKIDAESLGKVTTALQHLYQAQESLFKAQSRLFELQTSVESLTRELEAQKKWDERLASYVLSETLGGAHVYVSHARPAHYVCPACVAKQQLQVLQTLRSPSGVFQCPSCKYNYPIEPVQHLGLQRTITEYDPHSR